MIHLVMMMMTTIMSIFITHGGVRMGIPNVITNITIIVITITAIHLTNSSTIVVFLTLDVVMVVLSDNTTLLLKLLLCSTWLWVDTLQLDTWSLGLGN